MLTLSLGYGPSPAWIINLLDLGPDPGESSIPNSTAVAILSDNDQDFISYGGSLETVVNEGIQSKLGRFCTLQISI